MAPPNERPRPFNLNHFLFNLCVALWHTLLVWCRRAVHFVCCWLCRAPQTPIASVQDVRANRIRLSVEPRRPSFIAKRVEQHEVQWRGPASNDWVSMGVNNFPNRTVAKLQPCTNYVLRVRAVNPRGVSSWTPELHARTRMDPVNGGGSGPGFTWEQTPTDVTIAFQLPPGTTKKGIHFDLSPAFLRINVDRPDGKDPLVLIEGKLYGRVESFQSGSFWELVREEGKLVLILTLEKACKSVAPKFDYWRAIIPGQDEIDTHKLDREKEGVGMNMINPGDLDAMQMRNMGVPGF